MPPLEKAWMRTWAWGFRDGEDLRSRLEEVVDDAVGDGVVSMNCCRIGTTGRICSQASGGQTTCVKGQRATMMRDEGKTTRYCSTYLATCSSLAPIHEKSRMSSGSGLPGCCDFGSGSDGASVATDLGM